MADLIKQKKKKKKSMNLTGESLKFLSQNEKKQKKKEEK